jgi:hypothetical protein
MKSCKWKPSAVSLIVLAWLLFGATVDAQDIVSFDNGYITFTNGNTNLFYTVEYRPNLTGADDWDGTYSRLINIQSTNQTVRVPVGLLYRVVGKSNAVYGVGGNAARVPKTGQTILYRTGDDGDLQKGVAWPNPRFTVTTNGTDVVVTDDLTGLIWVKVPHGLSGNYGYMNWSNAIDFCISLTYAGHSNWRLPNYRELLSLIDARHFSPALPIESPFTGIESIFYWSATSYAGAATDYAWGVNMFDGRVFYTTVQSTYRVWPVSGGR